jgi:diguanylate cyclase (GGDEF)-like protein/putative nucleotidyltransferase with HDIG domain
MSTAAATSLVGFVMRRKARIACLLLSASAVGLAGVGVVNAVSGWRAVDATASVRQSFTLLRAGAAHEAAYLRNLRADPDSSEARQAFFAAAQAQTSLLTVIDEHVPADEQAVVRKLESDHLAALTRATRGLRSGSATSSRDVSAALGLFRSVELGAIEAQRLASAGGRPWPSTRRQQLELADLAVVLLAGVLSLVRSAFRAAGLRRADGHEEREIQRLLHAALSDSLTGLANHRAFQDDLAEVIEQRNRAGTPFSLLAFDLDGLKQVNDAEGHQAGDLYIRTVASCIRDVIGDRGTVYRTGGDEFMAILPACRGWHALAVAHAIQRESNERTGKRALSIGITESVATEGRRVLLHQADLALYEAKRGKLLAVTYHEGLEPRQVDAAATGPSEHQKMLAAALAHAVDARDSGTRNHSETVAELCVAIGIRLVIGGVPLERLRIAGLLHDVGKIAVSDAVLSKPGALAPDEREEIEQHASVGYSILNAAGLKIEAEWVLHHHERFDGAGYPSGRAGQKIPIESRIIAVADAFEAMTGSRPYRTTLTPEQALLELAAHSGTQFDPACVQALNELFGGDELATAQAAEHRARLVAIA